MPIFQISRRLLVLCAGLAILASLVIIVTACFDPAARYPIIQATLLAMATLWASLPVAASHEDLAIKTAYFGSLFFAIFYFIASQTITAFWITLVVLTGIVVVEHWRRLDHDPPYTRLAQIVTVLSLTAAGMRHFTKLFLPALQSALDEQYTWLMQALRLREALALLLGGIILYATGINTIRRLRALGWRVYPAPTSTNTLVVAIAELREYVVNCWRYFSLAFVTILREAIVYVVNTLFNPNLLRTILYSAATAAIASALIGEAFFIHPYLLTVLRSTDPFLAPSRDLSTAYGILAAAFAVTVVALGILIWISLPRAATRAERRPAWQRFTLTTAASGVCIWLAATTAWIINSAFQLDDRHFLAPGYFMAIIVPFTLWAAVQAARSGKLWSDDGPEDK